METLANLMKERLAANTKVVVNSLLKPRFIPNLMPRHDPDRYSEDKYYPEYIARLGDGTTSLSGDQLAKFDQQIAQVNGETNARMQAVLGDRLTFVDIYTACDQHDGKHYANRYVLVPEKGYMFRNMPIEVLFGHFQRGGIAGLDNMHPTVVGYAVLAQTVLQALQSPATVSIDDAYNADTLLNDLVGSFPLFQIEMALLGSFGLFRSSLPWNAPAGAAVA
jgi:hypothetical protein